MVVEPGDRLLPRSGRRLPRWRALVQRRAELPLGSLALGMAALGPRISPVVVAQLEPPLRLAWVGLPSPRLPAQAEPTGGIWESSSVMWSPSCSALRLREAAMARAGQPDSASRERRDPGARRLACVSGAQERALLLVAFVAAFPFLYAAQPSPGIGKTGAMPSSSPRRSPSSWRRSCAGSERRARNRRLAPGALAALVLVGGVGLTLSRPPFIPALQSDAALPGVGRTSWSLLARQPEQLAHGARRFAASMGCPLRLFELLARLRRRVPIRRPCHGEPCGARSSSAIRPITRR